MYADKRAACVLPFFSHPCCLPIAELASRERSEGAMNPNRSLDRPMGMGLSFFGFPKRFGMKWRRRSCCVFFFGADGRIVAKEVYLCRVSPR